MSLRRIFAIVRKDLSWAMGNMKLLGIMILPVFTMVFFSRLDSAATFVFSIVFVNAFVGIFSTSYLVIEEKNKGTLLALLTTPLTGAELLLGKFFFNLVLCSFFSFLVILINHRFDLLVQPLALINILLFAGTTCFIGFITGVFFKNEQEMSVLAPFLMLVFCFGDAAEKLSDKNNVHAFFPDFHVSQSVKDIAQTSGDLWVHSLFSLLLFAIAFFAASFYTQFYFSNSREKRWSGRLLGFSLLFVATLLTSGIYANQHAQLQKSMEDLQQFEFNTPSVTIGFHYDHQKLQQKTLLQSRAKSMELLSFKKNKDSNIVFAIRDLESDEQNLKDRNSKLLSDERRQVLSHQSLPGWQDQKLEQWVYVKLGSFVLLREQICGPQIFQYSLDVKLDKMKNFEKDLKTYFEIFKSIKMQCQHL